MKTITVKCIQLPKNGYDPGTWAEAKQEFMEGWKDEALRNVDEEATPEECMENMANVVLKWVCDQLKIEEHEIAQGK